MTHRYELPVISQSMTKSFRRCPRQFRYKYVEELAPKVISKPLTRGKWFHSLLETYYRPDDDPNADTSETWQSVHKRMSKKFGGLFDEEKDVLGDLPREMSRLMKSYLWHYENDRDWTVHEVEKTIEVPLPGFDDILLRLRVDMLVEDDYGLWIVDHKTHKTLPNTTARVLDVQSPIYVWAAHEAGIPVSGFKWNYIRTKAPSEPKMVYVGTKRERLSTAALDTDYPTYVRTIKRLKQEYGLKITRDIKAKAEQLKSQRYRTDEVQTSSFFQRVTFERKPETIDQAIRELRHTAERIRAYDFDPDRTERVPDRSCQFMCGYRELCMAELIDGNADVIRRKNFTKKDPWDYYQEGKPDAPEF